ncbi:MAG TPA: hypothetical protein VFG11_02925, partial [Acidobacteriota bacterium]|nr:hypothetical protein [Acidobacteriota bacterium]
MNSKISSPYSWLRFCGMAAILCMLLSSNSFAFDQDYVRYGAVLKEYVVAGRVNYAALQKNRGPIDHVIKEFSSVKP